MAHGLSFSILLLVCLMVAACAPVPMPTPLTVKPTDMSEPTVAPRATAVFKPTDAPKETFAPATVTATLAPAKLPRTFVLDPQALADAKTKIAAGDKILAPAFKQLVGEANNALNFRPVSVMDKPQVADSGDKHDYLSLARYYWPDPTKPNGLPYISRDGETNPEMDTITDKADWRGVINASGALAQAYYFTGDEKYAQKTAEILRVWFLNPDTRMNPNGTYAQVMKGRGVPTGSGIIDFVHIAELVDYINLLDGSKAWTPADQQAIAT